MKLKNRNLYKKAFRAEFFLIAQEKLSDINRVEEFKENIMLDHRTETFMAVCSVMNYREAAELLHITQPAVTQHIQFLEKEYGCRLFLYENRKLIKTPAAQMLEDYLRSVQQRENFLREKIKNNGLRELRIGATKTIGDYVITDRIHDFLNQPDTALTLIVDNTKHLLHLLEQNTLDYAIIEGFFDKNRFGSQLYRREPFVGICPKDHPFAGREVSVEEILKETLIHREKGSGTLAILEEKLLEYNESLERFHRHICICKLKCCQLRSKFVTDGSTGIGGNQENAATAEASFQNAEPQFTNTFESDLMKYLCISSFKMIIDLIKSGYGISFVYEVLAKSDPELGIFTLKGEPIVREFNVIYLKHADVREKMEWFL